MTIEQKVKTIDVVKQMVADGQISQDVAEKYFPELKESGDEKIRKELINFFSDKDESDYEGLHPRTEIIAWLEKQGNIDSYVKLPTFTFDDILALQCCIKIATANEYKELYVQLKSLHDRVYDAYWLEKQGEQKPAEVEPKFHEGEWVVTDFDNVVRIKAIENGLYVFENSMRFSIGYVDKCWRKWCISDVKDGDVLVYNNGCVEIILLFKKWCREVGKGAYNYAHMTSSGHYAYINEWSDCGSSAHPATKEQRDALKKAMADVGYTFDFEKKELKKNLKE